MSTQGEINGPSILILDCSTSRGSIALALGRGGMYWGRDFSAGRGHGGELFRALEEAVNMAKTVYGASTDETDPASRGFLSEILVGLGPGSYSGVRQAVAVAGGLAAATGARLSGFASPLALRTDAKNYHAVGDARRGTFYHTAVCSKTEDRAATVARTSVVGPELLDGLDALNARLSIHPDWPVIAVESVSPGLPADTPVAWPVAMCLPLSDDLARHVPPLEPIYLRPVSITLPKPSL